MAHAYQFVDSIDPGVATILLDLDNGVPFVVAAGTMTAPPTMRRASSSSMLADGTITSGTAYDGRVINLNLSLVEAVPAEIQATAVQKLALILNSPKGAWLKWQSEGMAHPVYFRTERCSFDILDQFLTHKPTRALALDIPADPFAYGEKVSGSFVVSNATFVKSWTDPIQGDVATPLFLSALSGIIGKDDTTVAASIARNDGIAQASPYIKSVYTQGAPAATSGWTVTDTADATTIAGSRRRIARAAAGAYSGQAATPAVLTWPSLPAGEYRVLVRARVTVGTDVELVFAGGVLGVAGHTAPLLGLPIRNAPAGASGAGWDWYDMGVASLPAGAPQPDDKFKTSPVTATTNWSLYVQAAGITTVDLDSVLLVPVGGPGVLKSCYSMSQSPATLQARTLFLDGISDRRWYDLVGLLSPFAAIAGDLPVLVPGATNTLHILISTAVNDTGKGYADFSSGVLTWSYAYFPRYLGGFRPAAS